MTEEWDWAFEEGVRLFEAREDADAHAMFKTYLESGSPLRDEAQRYLDLIAARADRLLLAQASISLRGGHINRARKLLLKVVNMGGRLSQEAGDLLQQIEDMSAPESSSLEDQVSVAQSVRGNQEPTSIGEIRRTPHMDLSETGVAAPGSTLNIYVYTSRERSRPEEKSEDVLLDASGTAAQFELEVRCFASRHFVSNKEPAKQIRVGRETDTSNVVSFTLTVKSRDELSRLTEEVPSIMAVFIHAGRPSGRVSRSPIIEGVGPTSGAKEQEPRGEVRIESGAVPADLVILVVATSENDNRHFWCTVQTPLLPQYALGATQEWNLPDSASTIVNASMSNFTDPTATRLKRIAALKGAGRRLFEAAPAVFHEVFWALVDADRLPRTIAVVSAEPYIPWELMIPRRELGADRLPQTREPLGVEFIVSRWTAGNLTSAPQKINLVGSYGIAPDYSGSNRLKWAQDEVRFVTDHFKPGRVISPTTFEEINNTLREGRGLLHIACHGTSTNNGRQALYLDDRVTIDPEELLGLDGLEAGFREKRPLVFLNACEVGRTVPALVGLLGFAQSFIDIGASAVISPLWSVDDSIAHQIAEEFYRTILSSKDTPFADALRRIRAKAYDLSAGEDTYAAYCFYGDPLAVSDALGFQPCALG